MFMIETLVLTLIGFLLGALPFSVWIGRRFLGKDIRAYGDGNPGTFNVIRAGGIGWGGLALLLDISKGAIPSGLAVYVFDWDGLRLVPVAIAPVLGHAFSPFLGFKGGKAIATTGGMWIGLTLWHVPVVGMIALTFWYMVLTSSGWAVIFTVVSILVFLLMWFGSNSGTLYLIWLCSTLLFIYKHRHELVHRPVFRIPSSLLRWFR